MYTFVYIEHWGSINRLLQPQFASHLSPASMYCTIVGHRSSFFHLTNCNIFRAAVWKTRGRSALMQTTVHNSNYLLSSMYAHTR